MTKTLSVFGLLSAVLTASVLVLPSTAQEREVIVGKAFDVNPHFFLSKWDPQQERLIVYRSLWSENTPAVHLLSTDGRTLLSISPLAELTEYNHIDIWDVAAKPDGGAALAAVLKSADGGLTYVILIYNDRGNLTQMWQVAPYFHLRIAVGPDNSVYAFGDRTDVKSLVGQGEEDARLLIHYSKDGKVLQEQLPLSFFEKGLDVTRMNVTSGEHHMMFAAGSLVLYLSSSREVFVFDAELRVKRRISLTQTLNELQGQTGSDGVRIVEVSFDGNTIYVQAQLWTEGSKPTATVKLVAIDSKTQAWRIVGNDLFDKNPGRLLQVGTDGEIMVLRRVANDVTQLDWFKP